MVTRYTGRSGNAQAYGTTQNTVTVYDTKTNLPINPIPKQVRQFAETLFDEESRASAQRFINNQTAPHVFIGRNFTEAQPWQLYQSNTLWNKRIAPDSAELSNLFGVEIQATPVANTTNIARYKVKIASSMEMLAMPKLFKDFLLRSTAALSKPPVSAKAIETKLETQCDKLPEDAKSSLGCNNVISHQQTENKANLLDSKQPREKVSVDFTLSKANYQQAMTQLQLAFDTALTRFSRDIAAWEEKGVFPSDFHSTFMDAQTGRNITEHYCLSSSESTRSRAYVGRDQHALFYPCSDGTVGKEANSQYGNPINDLSFKAVDQKGQFVRVALKDGDIGFSWQAEQQTSSESLEKIRFIFAKVLNETASKILAGANSSASYSEIISHTREVMNAEIKDKNSLWWKSFGQIFALAGAVAATAFAVCFTSGAFLVCCVSAVKKAKQDKQEANSENTALLGSNSINIEVS